MILYVDDICAINLQRTDGNSAVGQRRRGGRCVHRQRENGKSKNVGLRAGSLNFGTFCVSRRPGGKEKRQGA